MFVHAFGEANPLLVNVRNDPSIASTVAWSHSFLFTIFSRKSPPAFRCKSSGDEDTEIIIGALWSCWSSKTAILHCGQARDGGLWSNSFLVLPAFDRVSPCFSPSFILSFPVCRLNVFSWGSDRFELLPSRRSFRIVISDFLSFPCTTCYQRAPIRRAPSTRPDSLFDTSKVTHRIIYQ